MLISINSKSWRTAHVYNPELILFVFNSVEFCCTVLKNISSTTFLLLKT